MKFTKYYIAYGSNLYVEQMERRCPGACIAGTAMLEGWQLLYRGSKTGSYLTIERAEGKRIPVVIWSVTRRDEQALDRYEGYPTFYYKEKLNITFRDYWSGRTVKAPAFVYIMHEDRPYGVPTHWYEDVCKVGYKYFDFDESFLDEAKKESIRRIEEEGARVCPICGKAYTGAPAVSRRDNHTVICPECGIREAMEDFIKWNRKEAK